MTFRSPWWLRGPHVQTLYSTLTRRRPQVSLRPERFELPDGDFVDLAWAQPEPADTTAPLVVVLHGLEGSVESPYARGILRALTRQGWRAVLMHFRGCSGVPNRLDRAYHSGDTADFDDVVSALRARFPDAPMAAVGYSLGANVLVKWLGEADAVADRPLNAAVAVSPPFDLAACADHLNRGPSRIYQARFVRSLKASYAAKRALPSAVAAIDSIRQWDDIVTAPTHGFKDADDYYRQSSCAQFLPRVAVPTLVLHAIDDPFLPRTAIPDPRAVSASVQLKLLSTGGHVGFIHGSSPRNAKFWLESEIPRFLTQRLQAST